MKNVLYLVLFTIVSFSACGNDDEGNSGNGGANGDLTVTLSWDQTDADLDLELYGPDDLYVTNGFSTLQEAAHSGDDISGPGEEEINLMDAASDGYYRVNVEWFEGLGDITYTIVITSAESTLTFSDVINSTEDIKIANFTKTGRSLQF